MAVVLLLFVVGSSMVIVRFAAVAFELTGLPWDEAKFQALSAFSNTGFTTKEAELIVNHPVRRKIASYLIILGNAGFITTVGTFASSIMQESPFSFVRDMLLVVVGLILLVWLARRETLGGRLRKWARERLLKGEQFQPSSLEEMLHFGDNYTLSRIVIPTDSPAVDQSLAQLKLNEKGVQVLSIERDTEFVGIPTGTDKILSGDRLIVYGQEQSFGPAFFGVETEEARLSTVSLSAFPDAGPESKPPTESTTASAPEA